LITGKCWHDHLAATIVIDDKGNQVSSCAGFSDACITKASTRSHDRRPRSAKARKKTYRAIGHFMFEFSQTEYTIRHYLAEEIGLNEEHFAAVVESYDVGALCTVAIEVFTKARAEENAILIKTLINRFRRLNDERKRVAHGLWVPFKEGGTVHYVSRSSLKPTWSTNQAEALEKLADKACKLDAELKTAFMYAPEQY
jgi:hypothetical protein